MHCSWASHYSNEWQPGIRAAPIHDTRKEEYTPSPRSRAVRRIVRTGNPPILQIPTVWFHPSTNRWERRAAGS